jgi:hypothetical protein
MIHIHIPTTEPNLTPKIYDGHVKIKFWKLHFWFSEAFKTCEFYFLKKYKIKRNKISFLYLVLKENYKNKIENKNENDTKQSLNLVGAHLNTRHLLKSNKLVYIMLFLLWNEAIVLISWDMRDTWK